MTDQDRLDLQWRLLNDAHPKFCIKLRRQSSALGILTEPIETDELTFQEFQKAKSFHDNLMLLPDVDLAKAGQAVTAREQAEYEAKHAFNQLEAVANDDIYDFWSRAELWTLGESAALINERNPLFVNEDRIVGDRSQSKIAIKLKQTLELLERARRAGSLYRTNSPKNVINWVELKHIEMPQKLKELTLLRSGTIFTLSAENRHLRERLAVLEAQPALSQSRDDASKAEKPIGQRERESLLKLILGMAIKGYSYDPKATKSTQINEISGDLRIAGLALDEDTVRKYLNEAKTTLADELNRTE
jgi:hypothetical protein